MYTLGPLMSQDPILLAKIVRIGRTFFKDYYSTGSNSLQQDSPTIVRILNFIFAVSSLYGVFCYFWIGLGVCCVFVSSISCLCRMRSFESSFLCYLKPFCLPCRCCSVTVAWQKRCGEWSSSYHMNSATSSTGTGRTTPTSSTLPYCWPKLLRSIGPNIL